MKLTDTDVKFFQTLHDSQIGAWLQGYTDRLISEVCDARTNSYPDEVRKQTAQILQTELIDRIQLIMGQPVVSPETFE